ncbi:MAG: DUF3793 family protein [Synergistaceae bacterium]|nr:DUF3793 family protein [Synergistaceae bacterium]
MTLLRDKDTGEYIERLLACVAAPTIRGLKPGTLVNLRRHGDGEIPATWNERKEELLRKFRVEAFAFFPKGVGRGDSLLLLLYKKELLIQTLLSEEAANILLPLGYKLRPPRVNSWFERLARRFEGDFPHEIGLFLGYPPEDVQGFIQNRGGACLANGYWKVYSNVCKAKQTFQKFRRAEYDAARAFIAGCVIMRGNKRPKT